MAKIVAGFVIVTILTILAERWLSDRTAIAVLVVSLLGFGFLSQQEISQFLVWARANKPATIVGCMAVFAVIGLVIGIRATKDVKPVEAPSPPPITKSTDPLPHLQAWLVIDAVRSADIDFHIEAENIGERQVTDLRGSMSTPEMTAIDVSLPLPPTLPPRGRLSIPGLPVSGLRKHGILFVDLNYDSQVGGTVNKFTSHYSFAVRPTDMKPKSLLPETWRENTGIVLGPEQNTMEAAVKTLAGPQGTMLFGVPVHRPDGSPNLVAITNEKRRFIFDGRLRSVSFTTKPMAVDSKTISRALPGGSYDAIVIGCIWDEPKDEAKLIINGKVVP